MLKVLIVDDEKIVRIGLRTIIQWEENGFQLVGEARDGTTALEMVNKFSPEIIVTDLKMPGMDGIALIKALSGNKYKGKILVLSNYEEFELVRDAMKYGASDYLLKITMNPSEFLKVLKQLSEELSSERKSNEENLKIREEIIENREIAVDKFLKEIFEDNTPDPADLQAKSSKLGLEIDRDCVLIYISIDNFENGKTIGKIKNVKLFKESVINIIKESVSNSMGIYALDLSQKEFAAIVSGDLCKSSEKLAVNISEMIKIYLNVTASIVISTKATGMLYLKERLESCRHAVNIRFYRGGGTVIREDEISFHNNTFWCGHKNSAADVKQFVSIGELPAAFDFFNDIMQTAEKENVWPNAFKEFVMIIMNDLDGLFLQWGMENILELADYKLALQEAETIEEYKEKLFELLKIIYEKICCLKSGVYRKEVTQVIEYINKHIADRISLEMIAKNVNLSEGYLCRMFKNETGKNLVNLINEMKMQKARDLLEKTDMIVKEVAKSVGIEDQFYFNKIFKKYVGISPSEYKKRVGQNNTYIR